MKHTRCQLHPPPLPTPLRTADSWEGRPSEDVPWTLSCIGPPRNAVFPSAAPSLGVVAHVLLSKHTWRWMWLSIRAPESVFILL